MKKEGQYNTEFTTSKSLTLLSQKTPLDVSFSHILCSQSMTVIVSAHSYGEDGGI